ncbi:MAG: hypothetical protein R3321_05690 [Nitrososphaeraceae archaeon]|nr:hypothetical protein [Nitrososphaeraceae archaeon]
MSEEKSNNQNPYVQCIKCRNLWVAVGLLSVVAVLVFGFTLFEFANLINLLIMFDVLRYGGVGFVIFLCGYLAFRFIKDYCTEKFSGEYKRDSGLLIGGSIAIGIIIIAVAIMTYFIPITLEEYQFRETYHDVGIEQAIKGLTCKTFRSSSDNWFRYTVVDYQIFDWTPEKGLYDLKTQYSKYEPERRAWLADKFKECWT